MLLEDLAEVVARLRMQRVDGERLTVRVGREVPLVLKAEHHAEVIVRFRQVDAQCHDGTIVLLCLRPLSGPAVERNQVGMRIGQRRIDGECCFVRGNGSRQIALVGKLRPPLHVTARVVSELGDTCEHPVVERRPQRAMLLVLRQRAPGIVCPSQRAIRPRERVVGRAKLREERHGALEMCDRLSVPSLRRRDAAEAKQRRGLGSGLLHHGHKQ